MWTASGGATVGSIAVGDHDIDAIELASNSQDNGGSGERNERLHGDRDGTDEEASAAGLSVGLETERGKKLCRTRLLHEQASENKSGRARQVWVR